MSKITLSGNSLGTGTISIAAPNTNSDRTIALPDEAGTMLVNGTNQNVGIGTTTPEWSLHIKNAIAPVIQLEETSVGNTFIGQDANGFFVRRTSLSNADALAIDSAGRVLMAYQPSFDAYSPAVTGTGVVVVFGLTRHNTGNHYNAATGLFTAPVAGLYMFRFSLLMGNPYTSSYHRVLWSVNGTSSTTFGDTLTDKGGNVSYHSAVDTLIIRLAANDTVSVKNDGPIPTYGTSYGSFGGYLVC